MQYHDLLEQFGSTAVGGTATGWSEACTVMGLGLMVRSNPIVTGMTTVIGFGLNLIDFVLNKILLGTLPARITDFKLDFIDHQVALNDTTCALVSISLENDPPAITTVDILNQVLNFLSFTNFLRTAGLPEPVLNNTEFMQKFLEDFSMWILGVVKDFCQAAFENNSWELDEGFRKISWNDVEIRSL